MYPDPSPTLPHHLRLRRLKPDRQRPTLPVELITLILGFVNRWEVDEREEGSTMDLQGCWVRESGCSQAVRQHTLKQCCLVSRLFQNISEHLLYRIVDIDFDLSDLALVNQLLSTPRLATLVYSVRVHHNHELCQPLHPGQLLPQVFDLISVLSNPLDLRFCFFEPTQNDLTQTVTFLRDYAITHPNWLLVSFTLRFDFVEFNLYNKTLLLYMLSRLPPTLESLTLSSPFYLEVSDVEAPVQFPLSQLHLTQPEFNSSLLGYLTCKSRDTLRTLVLETDGHARNHRAGHPNRWKEDEEVVGPLFG
ncbi:hypothetical protein P7C70_g5804, partial [Phenoliferia sp. Uapishka_3]